MNYTEEAGAIVGRNGRFFNNRPLYGDNRASEALAGDRPHIRFTSKPNVYGCMTLAVQRGDASRWLHECADVTSRYRPGRMEWEISDPAFAGLTVRMEVLSLAATEGFGVKLSTQGAREGDRVIWTFGGSQVCGDASKQFDPNNDAPSKANPNPVAPVVSKCFKPEDCRDGKIEIAAGRFILTTRGTVRHVIGCCTRGEPRLADASAWADPLQLVQTPVDSLPLACGLVELRDSETIYWAVEAVEETVLASPACDDPVAAFARALARTEAVGYRVDVDTPDARLNAGVAAACYAMDSIYYPPVYVHGAMGWNIPFPGWRSFYGATALGWHENVKAEARYYIASQIRETTFRGAVGDPNRRLCTQAKETRYHGRGRITKDADPYNFQTQFFDQLVHAWRWTADPELEAVLREALALHLEWQQQCFDPDDDGLYESYINSWPTDSVWHNGGGSADESAYAYAGHVAASEMAARAGDQDAAARHAAQAEKIRSAILGELWLTRKGYVAQYKEQGGLARVHEDAWLNAVFLPIESGVLDVEQAVQALDYSEWGLERVPMPFGGSRCWSSNWVPAPWSTREMHPGDNYALALAYFRVGLADEGWDILQGNYLESMYYGVVPGGLSSSSTATDFADIVSPFCRTVVEGLFGYRPDYPNGIVTLAPQFPSGWDHAAITTPDATIRFRETVGEQQWHVTLTRPARLALVAQVNARSIASVEVNGAPSPWRVEPGFGCTLLVVEAAACSRMDAVVTFEAQTAGDSDVLTITGKVGDRIRVDNGVNRIDAFRDPQGVMKAACLADGLLTAEFAANPGHHLVLAQVRVGDLPQWRRIRICVADPVAEAKAAARTVLRGRDDSAWSCIDMRSALTADIRTIYQQEYLSPRPETCSLRIGVDGYSPWTFAFWRSPLPVIDLSHVPGLLDSDGTLQTPQGVPFSWAAEDRNIAFASLWDNWPGEISVPIGRSGSAVWFLLCGTTNPMQCRIANARLRLVYADGAVENVDIVPPDNFWTLCPLGGADYNYARDAFALPPTPPPTVQLGANCRAVLLGTRLRPGAVLKHVTLEALSQEVVIGLMGVTVEG